MNFLLKTGALRKNMRLFRKRLCSFLFSWSLETPPRSWLSWKARFSKTGRQPSLSLRASPSGRLVKAQSRTCGGTKKAMAATVQCHALKDRKLVKTSGRKISSNQLPPSSWFSGFWVCSSFSPALGPRPYRHQPGKPQENNRPQEELLVMIFDMMKCRLSRRSVRELQRANGELRANAGADAASTYLCRLYLHWIVFYPCQPALIFGQVF